MKKRIISLTMALLMACSLTVSGAVAVEQESVQSGGTQIADVRIAGEAVEPVDLGGVDPAQIVEIPESEDDSVPGASTLPVSRYVQTPQIDADDLKNAVEWAQPGKTRRAAARASANCTVSSLTDTMPEGQENRLYTVGVGAGDIIQARLDVPKNINLDYSLQLYTYNQDDQTLSYVTGCNYATESNFMPEVVGAVNRTNSSVVYVIAVLSNGNPSTTDSYTVTVSAGGTIDPYEPHESAFDPVTLNGISRTLPFNFRDVTLHSPIDNDWFAISASDLGDINGLTIKNVPSGVVVESYVFSGTTPIRTGSSQDGGRLKFYVGAANYIRVFSNNTSSSFSPISYSNIEFTPTLKATTATFYIAVNGYCQRMSNEFEDRIYRNLYPRNANVEVKILYTTSDGYPATVTDTVNVTVINPEWSSDMMRYSRGEGSVENGTECIVKFTGPQVMGSAWYNAVGTQIHSQLLGTIVSRSNDAVIDHYNNQETSKPCQHNGACGYK